MSARAIMVLGTASHVGKSLIATALCRLFSDQGFRVAPFKAQNMSLNSAATADGLEIGRAQALQAEAARTLATVDMNPILLKPTSEIGSQVVVLGRAVGNERAADYHRNRLAAYFPVVSDAYRRLAERSDIVVIEGAGSPAEINLAATDIVNMRVARLADARCLLVGDIDRGGVFAALLGTLALLCDDDRRRIRAFVINKFRGDPTLLAPGVAEIEARIERPCAGVVPWLRDIGLDDEDGVSLEDAPRVRARAWHRARSDAARPLRIAIVALPYLANATDFPALAAEPSVELAYADSPRDLEYADLVIVPGTKDTLGALRFIVERGFAIALREVANERLVFGICGGLQILGERVEDPHAVESGGAGDGIGLLALRTVLVAEKVTEPVRVRPHRGALFGGGAGDCDGGGYEIHLGRSSATASSAPFAQIVRRDGSGANAGMVAPNRRVAATYVHGLFGDDTLRHAFVRAARSAVGLSAPFELAAYGAERDARIDRLAAHVGGALDLRTLSA